MSHPLLDKFGEVLMTRVRDKAIADWDKIIGGEMRGESAQRIQTQLTTMTPEQIEALGLLVPQIVDTTLHHLLWVLEQNQSLDMRTGTMDTPAQSVRELSDGLTGEMHGSKGWIARFSKQRKD